MLTVIFSALSFVSFPMLLWIILSFYSGALQPSREPLAHSVAHGHQEEAPGLCRLPGHDLFCRRKRRHHRAEQCRAIQPQDKPVVPCCGHDIQTERGVCVCVSAPAPQNSVTRDVVVEISPCEMGQPFYPLTSSVDVDGVYVTTGLSTVVSSTAVISLVLILFYHSTFCHLSDGEKTAWLQTLASNLQLHVISQVI